MMHVVPIGQKGVQILVGSVCLYIGSGRVYSSLHMKNHAGAK
jgi:hypothetical protein